MTDLEAENAALRHGDSLCREALQRFVTDASTPTFIMARSAIERIEQLEQALREVADTLSRIPPLWTHAAEPASDS